jgi:hypothetical protein
MYKIDPKLKEWATPRQTEIIDAVIQTNGIRSAARQLGIKHASLQDTIKAVKKKAIKAGYSPEHDMTKTTPEGFHVKGISTYYNDEGKVKGQWVKTNADKEAQAEALKDFVDGLCATIPTRAKPVKLTKQKYDSDLMSLIILGDAHLGMYAWGEETLERDFDTDIACQEIRNAVDNMIARAPNAETGVLIDVGDFMHSNTATNTTAAGTVVDVDTRHAKVLKAAGMVMRYCITQMLKKYKTVKVVIAKGNHNPEPAIAVSLMLQFYYDKEKRVEVLDTIGHHHYIEFGDWLLGVNHGDKIKPQKLVAMMARDHKGWSNAKFRLWILGHIHHERVIEIDGCTVASFNTLAPRDAWHASAGYGSRSASTLITLHKTKGKHSTIEYDLPARET